MNTLYKNNVAYVSCFLLQSFVNVISSSVSGHSSLLDPSEVPMLRILKFGYSYACASCFEEIVFRYFPSFPNCLIYQNNSLPLVTTTKQFPFLFSAQFLKLLYSIP